MQPLEAHQVRRDLREAPLRGDDVEGDRDDLVDDRDRVAFEARVDADDVTLASFARVDAQVWQLIWIGEDDEPVGVSLAAGDAGHARVHPLVRAPRADEPSLAGDEGFAAVDENAHLRRPAALGQKRSSPAIGRARAISGSASSTGDVAARARNTSVPLCVSPRSQDVTIRSRSPSWKRSSTASRSVSVPAFMTAPTTSGSAARTTYAASSSTLGRSAWARSRTRSCDSTSAPYSASGSRAKS